MTSEDYEKVQTLMKYIVMCNDCKFYNFGICDRVKNAYGGYLICCEADGCTFGVRKDNENDI